MPLHGLVDVKGINNTITFLKLFRNANSVTKYCNNNMDKSVKVNLSPCSSIIHYQYLYSTNSKFFYNLISMDKLIRIISVTTNQDVIKF